MNHEQNRLDSFDSWPKNAPVAPVKIARAGFFYTGDVLEVQCYFCNEKLTTWSYGDQVMLKHRLKNPRCPFVLNPLSCGNVIIHQHFQTSNHSNETKICNMSKIKNYADSRVDMKNGLNRLRTFLNDPIFIPVKMYLLAVNGFYCTNSGDSIECTECNLQIEEWIGKFDPILHHKKFQPYCLKNKEIYLYPKHESCMPYCVVNSYDEEFSTFRKRLDTYDNWPHKYPDPGSLSFAGLYYTKENDFVRCYYCDIGLRKWLETDNPLVEHARNSSTCKFLIKLTSQSFIQMCNTETQEKNATSSSVDNICKLQAQIRDLKESKLCKICLDRDIAIAFVPCGHLLTCERCAVDMSICPLCRGQIHNTVRTYLS